MRKLLLFFALVLIGGAMWKIVIFPMYSRYGQKKSCLNTIRCLSCVCINYSSDNEDRYPNTWSETKRYTAGITKVFICPATDHVSGKYSDVDSWTDYILIPGKTKNDPATTVLIYEPLSNHGGKGGHVMYVNGFIKWYRSEEYCLLGL